MLFTVDHLGRKIVQGSAECLTAIAGRMDTPAEIADLEIALDAKQQILWLDVAMNDVLAVEVGQCVCHLGDVLWRE